MIIKWGHIHDCFFCHMIHHAKYKHMTFDVSYIEIGKVRNDVEGQLEFGLSLQDKCKVKII